MTEMIFVTGRSKRAIENHFEKSNEIGAELEARGKKALWGPRPGDGRLQDRKHRGELSDAHRWARRDAARGDRQHH
ncbi:hypothetical protein HDG38_006613 [Paraburkholderia sp. WSM4177]|nr:hypothetical protein [Paraburkholderia sp. WSM4177]MBB5488382.1 hypothetical protein [Paraburkholderia sp. WSM4180]